MESKNHCCDCSGEGACGSISCGGRSYFVIRWIFGFVAIMLAFCLGLQIGQLQSLAGVSQFGSYDRMYGHRGGMMDSGINYVVTMPSVEAGSVKTK